MSVKMIADFRRRPSLARRKAAREERLAARAEVNRILSERLHEKFGGPFVPVAAIDPGSPMGVAAVDAAETRLLDAHLQRGAKMMDFDRRFGF